MNPGLGWRYVYLWIGVFAAVSLVLIVFLLPETYHPQLLKHRAKKLRKEEPEKNKDKYADIEKADFSFKSLIVRTGGRPAKMLVTEPILLMVTIYLSVVYVPSLLLPRDSNLFNFALTWLLHLYSYGLLYGLFSLFPVIWEIKRGFNPGESGLVSSSSPNLHSLHNSPRLDIPQIFIGVGIGTTIGAAANVAMQRHYRLVFRPNLSARLPSVFQSCILTTSPYVISELVPKWHGHPPPEER